VKELELLSDWMLCLSQDRKRKGILGFFKFGEKSPYPLEFRLISRILGIFLKIQIKNGYSVRLSSADRLELSPSVQKLIDELLALRSDSKYISHQFSIQSAVNFITNPEKTITHFHNLLFMLTSDLYKHITIKNLFF
jgi:hypothetical protein